MNSTLKQDKGFSIIEVVLVLAIVALIFLMIFIAWPALQRSQRDTGRKQDASTVASAVASYRSNSNGTTNPTSSQVQGYISKLNQYDVSGVVVGTTTSMDPSDTVQRSRINVVFKKQCDSSNNATVSGTNRQFAVLYLIEGGGNWQKACLNG